MFLPLVLRVSFLLQSHRYGDVSWMTSHSVSAIKESLYRSIIVVDSMTIQGAEMSGTPSFPSLCSSAIFSSTGGFLANITNPATVVNARPSLGLNVWFPFDHEIFLCNARCDLKTARNPHPRHLQDFHRVRARVLDWLRCLTMSCVMQRQHQLSVSSLLPNK